MRAIGFALVLTAFFIFAGIFVAVERLPHWAVFAAALAILVIGIGGVVFLALGDPPQRRGN